MPGSDTEHKITAIKQQVKRPDRCSVFVDDKYCCSFSKNALLELELRENQELTVDELTSLKSKAEDAKWYDACLGLIVRRPRSVWEIETYLKRKGANSTKSSEILQKLIDRRLLDDTAFAEAWVRSRRLIKSTSTRKLQLELRQKRIQDDIISQVLSEDTTDDKDVLRELAMRKRRQTRYQDKTKLMQYLVRQGFNYGDVKEIVEDITNQ